MSKGRELVGAERDAARRQIALAKEMAQEQAQPAGPNDIAKALKAMSEMFNVPVPEAHGIALYELALSDLPAPAFKLACRAILKTHKWPRLPYPVEILEQGKIHAQVLQLFEDRCERALRLLK
jgi:hypothetical protein